MEILLLVLPILSLVLTLILGFIVLRRNPKNEVNQLFSVMSFLMAFWIFSAFMADALKETQKVLFWNKMAIIGPTLIAPLFLWFSWVFPIKSFEISKKKLVFIFLPTIPILIFSPTSLNVRGVTITKLGTEFRPGILYVGLLLLLIAYMGWGLYNFWISFKKSSGREKAQIQYLCLGTLGTLIPATTANLILPLFGYVKLSIFGTSTSLIFLGFTAYAITRYRFMDIRVTLGRGAVYVLSFATVILLAILLMFLNKQLTQPFTSNLLLVLGAFLSLLFFQLVKFYEKIAAQYFYHTFYNTQIVIADLEERLTQVLELETLSALLINTLKNTLKLEKIGILNKKIGEENYLVQEVINFKEEELLSLNEGDFLGRYLDKIKKPIVREELIPIIEKTKNIEEKEKLQKLQNSLTRLGGSLCLPLIFEGKIVGIIVLGDKISGEAFSSQDIELLNILSFSASIALKNASLYSEVRNRKEELEKFYRLTVGRELKMIELKNKIQEMEEKLRNK